MRRVRILIPTVAALLLSACGGSSEPAQPVAAEAAEAAEAASPEDAYLADLADQMPAYALDPARERWVEVGWDACKTLDTSDLTDMQIVASWVEVQGVEREHAQAGLEAARKHLCPEV